MLDWEELKTEKLAREDLIISLLRSESSALENSFNNNNNNTDDNDTYDGKIRGKISYIKMILSRLGNTVINKDRKKVRRKLYEIEKKESLKRGKSYIKSPEWVVNKRATKNPKNDDNKCFQYSIAVALHHQDFGNHPERITNIGLHIGLYNWEGI